MTTEHKPHSEHPLPTVAECDERIAEVQHVIDHPDEYDVEVRVQAHRDQARWKFNRRFAERVTDLEEQLEAARTALEQIATGPSETSPPEIARCALGWPAHGWESLRSIEQQLLEAMHSENNLLREEVRLHVSRLEEQLEALREALGLVSECADALTEDGYAYLVDAANEALGSNPASVPLDPKFPYHVEGCVCPRFNDIAPALIADLTCPVHGVKGTDPGDRLGVPDPAREPKGEWRAGADVPHGRLRHWKPRTDRAVPTTSEGRVSETSNQESERDL